MKPIPCLANRARTLMPLVAMLAITAATLAPVDAQRRGQQSTSAADAPELIQFRSRYYDVHTDLARDEVRDLVNHMDQVALAYNQRFASFRPQNEERPSLFLLSGNDAYQAVLAGFGIDGTNSGGMFARRGDGFQGLFTFINDQSQDRVLHTLQHEGFHQFAWQRIGGGLPIWANEGIAEYFGNAIMVRGELRTGVFPASAIHRMQQAIRADAYLPFDDLINMSGTEWNRRLRSGDPRARLAYLQSWSVAHFLVHADNGRYRSAFDDYLRAIYEGQSPSQAAQTAFKTDQLQPFEDAWKEYMLQHIKPDPLTTARERMLFLTAGIGELAKRGEAAPASMEQLERALKKINFRYENNIGHGIVVVFDSDDEELFDPPLDERGRDRFRFELTAPEAEGFPGGVRIEPIAFNMRVAWVPLEEPMPDGTNARLEVIID